MIKAQGSLYIGGLLPHRTAAQGTNQLISSPAPEAEPNDVAEIGGGAEDPAGGQLRLLWKEATQLGLLPTSAAVPGPLGAILSEAAQADLHNLIGRLQEKGVTFATSWNDRSALEPSQTVEKILTAQREHGEGFRLRVSQKDQVDDGSLSSMMGSSRLMESVPVEDLRDLKILEATTGVSPTGHLEQPELAQKLVDLQKIGYRPLQMERATDRVGEASGHQHHNARKTRVGAYGAYRALTSQDEREAERLWAHKAGTHDAFRVESPEKVEALAFFELGQVGFEGQDPLATSLKSLARKGFTFETHLDQPHNYADRLDTASTWKRLSDDSRFTKRVAVGVRGHGYRMASVDQILEPEHLDPALTHLNQFYNQQITPRITAGEITQREADFLVGGLASEHPGGTLPERYQALNRLTELETGLHPDSPRVNGFARAERQFHALLKMRDPEEPVAELVDALADLRQKLPYRVAVNALAYFRDQLPAQVLDREDFEEQKAQLIEVAAVASDFKTVPSTYQLLRSGGVQEPYSERLRVFQAMSVAYAELPMDEKGTFDKGTPLEEAAADYRAILEHKRPEHGLLETAKTAAALHKQLVPRLGWKASRECFIRFQKMSARAPELTLESYLEEMGQTLDRLEQSRSGAAARELSLEEEFLSDKPRPKELQVDLQTVLSQRLMGQNTAEAADTLAQVHEKIGAKTDTDHSRKSFASFHRRFQRGHYDSLGYPEAREQFLEEHGQALNNLATAYEPGSKEFGEAYGLIGNRRMNGQGVREASLLFASLHQALSEKEQARGGQAEELYQRLVTEYDSGVFAGRSPDEVVQDFVKASLLTDNWRQAYVLARLGDTGEEEISFEEDAVLVGDFRLPVDF